ncbi:MAG: hypothetical protein IJE04_04820 [Bacilli bacterium]|nr:hypothetical protein [Bacilli bacterium]
MQNNIINRISPTVRIICLFILSISLFMAKSIFLILFITTLTLILMLITEKKVNIYVNMIKKIAILLLFFLIVYIIMFEYNTFNWLIFIYKLIIIILLFVAFYLNTSFEQLHQAIYGCLRPLEKMKINVEEFSFDIIIALFLMKSLIKNRQKILHIQKIYGKKQLNLRNYILTIFINSANQLNELQWHLKIKFYKLTYKENDGFSKFILILFVVLFIFVVFKEVIL